MLPSYQNKYKHQNVLQRQPAILTLFHTEEAGAQEGNSAFLKSDNDLVEELQTEPPFADSHCSALSTEACCLPVLSRYARHLHSCIFSADILSVWNWTMKTHNKPKTVNIPSTL